MSTENFIRKILVEIINGQYSFISNKKEQKYLIRNSKLNFNQYITLQQRGGNICGFYSLFNMIYFTRFLKTKNPIYLNKMNNNFKFWKFYIKSLNYLLNNLTLQKPALKSLISNGPLERYQLRFLIKNNKKIISSLNDDNNYQVSILDFFFFFLRFNGTKTEAINFQNGINNFLTNSNKKKILIIILGIVNHWNLLFIERDINNNNNYYFLDSRNCNEKFNVDYENSESNEMKKIINEFINNSKLYSHQNPTDWWIQCLPIWIKDMNVSLEFLFEISKGKINLFDIIINEVFSIFVSSFEESTFIDLNDNINYNNDDIINKILLFMKSIYPPLLFEGEIYRYFNDFQYKNINKIKCWEKFIKIMNIFKIVISIKEKSEDENIKEKLNKYLFFIQYFIDINQQNKTL